MGAAGLLVPEANGENILCFIRYIIYVFIYTYVC